jgi:hypothetical protein
LRVIWQPPMRYGEEGPGRESPPTIELDPVEHEIFFRDLKLARIEQELAWLQHEMHVRRLVFMQAPGAVGVILTTCDSRLCAAGGSQCAGGGGAAGGL